MHLHFYFRPRINKSSNARRQMVPFQEEGKAIPESYSKGRAAIPRHLYRRGFWRRRLPSSPKSRSIYGELARSPGSRQRVILCKTVLIPLAVTQRLHGAVSPICSAGHMNHVTTRPNQFAPSRHPGQNAVPPSLPRFDQDIRLPFVDLP